MNKSDNICKYILSFIFIFILVGILIYINNNQVDAIEATSNREKNGGCSILIYTNNVIDEYQDIYQKMAEAIHQELSNRGNTVTVSSELLDGYDIVFEIGFTTETGISTYYYQEDYEKLAGIIQDSISLSTYASNHGISYSEVGSSLMFSIHLGNLYNKEEMHNLSSSSYQKRIAEGIANGIEEYLESCKSM